MKMCKFVSANILVSDIFFNLFLFLQRPTKIHISLAPVAMTVGYK